jgi:hypothetical protein
LASNQPSRARMAAISSQPCAPRRRMNLVPGNRKRRSVEEPTEREMYAAHQAAALWLKAQRPFLMWPSAPGSAISSRQMAYGRSPRMDRNWRRTRILTTVPRNGITCFSFPPSFFRFRLFLAAQHFPSYSDSLIEYLIRFGVYNSTIGDYRSSAQPA